MHWVINFNGGIRTESIQTYVKNFWCAYTVCVFYFWGVKSGPSNQMLLFFATHPHVDFVPAGSRSCRPWSCAPCRVLVLLLAQLLLLQLLYGPHTLHIYVASIVWLILTCLLKTWVVFCWKVVLMHKTSNSILYSFKIYQHSRTIMWEMFNPMNDQCLSQSQWDLSSWLWEAGTQSWMWRELPLSVTGAHPPWLTIKDSHRFTPLVWYSSLSSQRHSPQFNLKS